MTQEMKDRIQRRFDELVHKELTEGLTAAEKEKLERYQKLRRPRRTQAEIVHEAETDWQIKKYTKQLKTLCPNVRHL